MPVIMTKKIAVRLNKTQENLALEILDAQSLLGRLYMRDLIEKRAIEVTKKVTFSSREYDKKAYAEKYKAQYPELQVIPSKARQHYLIECERYAKDHKKLDSNSYTYIPNAIYLDNVGTRFTYPDRDDWVWVPIFHNVKLFEKGYLTRDDLANHDYPIEKGVPKAYPRLLSSTLRYDRKNRRWFIHFSIEYESARATRTLTIANRFDEPFAIAFDIFNDATMQIGLEPAFIASISDTSNDGPYTHGALDGEVAIAKQRFHVRRNNLEKKFELNNGEFTNSARKLDYKIAKTAARIDNLITHFQNELAATIIKSGARYVILEDLASVEARIEFTARCQLSPDEYLRALPFLRARYREMHLGELYQKLDWKCKQYGIVRMEPYYDFVSLGAMQEVYPYDEKLIVSPSPSINYYEYCPFCGNRRPLDGTKCCERMTRTISGNVCGWLTRVAYWRMYTGIYGTCNDYFYRSASRDERDSLRRWDISAARKIFLPFHWRA